MKVVLFCGGQGMRLRDHDENVPKPLVKIGYRPIIWHVMKYYAHFGHKDFILALGHQATAIKNYFLQYSEYESNDFILTNGGRDVTLLNSDIADWRITFVDTGLKSSVGERLAAVRHLVEGEEWFLANYTDGLTDVDLNRMIEFGQSNNHIATFLAVKPNVTFHTVDIEEDGRVMAIRAAQAETTRINGGFFVMQNKVFEYMEEGEELVEAPFGRMIEESRLGAYVHDGFWACMDTFKEKQMLDEIHESGLAPWLVWRNEAISRLGETRPPLP
ncbi:MAG TPA: sugar phosphate nucleotidyltransferase [Acidimicrobiia bacterium]|jgi:glucose-1-phosphate cytidylyltransferase|nr:sugar phosphate nucleotidyltransferase [Acidimicrobiia bacterium]